MLRMEKKHVRKFDNGSYSLVLLDLMIPQKSAVWKSCSISGRSSTVPIIIVSAKDTDADKTLVWDLGQTIILRNHSL